MVLETIGKFALFADLVGITILIVFLWLDLRRQGTDLGKVGSVTLLIALCFVFYFIGLAFVRL